MKKFLLLISIFGIIFGLKAQNETVNGNLTVNGNISQKITGTPSVWYHLIQSNNQNSGFWANNGNPALYLRDINGNLNVVARPDGSSYFNGGNIGIGTTNTGNGLLTLNGNHINLLRLENDNPGKEAMLRFRSKSTNGGTLHSDISTYATGSNQGYLGFKVPSNNTVNSGFDMVINHSGYVGIGTTNPDMKLTVKGNIHAEEVKIDLNVPAPDYVFKENYNLRSIKELENFIKENSHLPEIPSAKEFEQNGVMLAEMDMNLLKKIEELTLYTIQQQKEISELKALNKQLLELQSRLEKLESEK